MPTLPNLVTSPFLGEEWQQLPCEGVDGGWLRSGTGDWVAKNPSQGGPSWGGECVQDLEVSAGGARSIVSLDFT